MEKNHWCKSLDVGKDIFYIRLCLSGDNNMALEQQGRIIEVIRACFEFGYVRGKEWWLRRKQ